MDSLRYFWAEKSPSQAGEDLSRIIKTYSSRFGQAKAVIMGFSLGADVILPIYNNLTSKAAENVSSLVLLSPSTKASFEVHISEWIGISGEDEGRDLLPELNKAIKPQTLCIYGEEEKDDTLCTLEIPQAVKVKKFLGDHHFDGDYEEVAKFILDNLNYGSK